MWPVLFSVFRRMLPPVFVALSAGVAPANSAAELLEVEQSVFGMDCAPCAYGVEKSLKKIQGVTEVTVSLNEGLVKMLLAPENRVTLKEIRQRILDNGFTPKEAMVRISGTIDTGASPLRLTTAGNIIYVLAPSAAVGEADLGKLKAMGSGSEIEVQGRIEAGANDPFPVSVTAFSALR